MYFKPNGDIQYKDPRLHTKANLRAGGYESLFKHFKECSKTNIDRFHKKLMKVDVYKIELNEYKYLSISTWQPILDNDYSA